MCMLQMEKCQFSLNVELIIWFITQHRALIMKVQKDNLKGIPNMSFHHISHNQLESLTHEELSVLNSRRPDIN